MVIAGRGVATLETALALVDLAPERTEVTVIALCRFGSVCRAVFTVGVMPSGTSDRVRLTAG